MKSPRTHLSSRRARLHAAVTATSVAAAMLAFGPASAADSSAPARLSPVQQATHDLAANYRLQQWQRLAGMHDRDDLIAAVLLGTQQGGESHPLPGHRKAEDQLASRFGRDPLAQFALALACQQQEEICAHPDSRDVLVHIAPDNAVHWLLLANDGPLDDAQLHRTANAANADSHLRDIFRLVGKALAGQPAPSVPAGVDPGALAVSLRLDALENVPLPKFDKVVGTCKRPSDVQRDDCLAVARLLDADRSGAILSRMIASAMVRRLLRGTPEEAAAKQLRRDYVWMSERMEAAGFPDPERIKAEDVRYGEWNAWQRAVERTGASATPAADWTPKNPETLLLSEERKPAASK